MSRPALVAALAALVLCPAAAGHTGGGRGYESTPHGFRPRLPGVYVSVLERDDRLWLENDSGKAAVVLGYDGEPYLRFAPDGVYRNARSPATYLNEDRYAKVELPARADVHASPQWVKVTGKRAWDWHDHRIHWMSTVPPPRVRADPSRPHHVFDWKVPLESGGRRYAIVGSLDWAPPRDGGGGIPAALWVAPGVAAVAGAAAVVVLVRRGRRSRAED
jgi:hypothetical protein